MDVLVVGAGVVGLAVARALALRGCAVIVAEAAGGIGSGVSSRNSEVIHAGLYYPEGSLRARHCVAGNRLLYAFCESHGIGHRRCGKLIVATTRDEVAGLDALHDRGRGNDVTGLERLTAAQARALEPELTCEGALLSSTTGIVDSHAMMLALQGDCTAAGGVLAFNAPVERLERAGSGWIATVGGAEPMQLPVDAVVNGGALDAQALARKTDGYPAARVPPLVLAKGNYFGLRGRSPFSRLVYPAPVDGGLGIHGTLDLAGRLRFGPDVEWVGTRDLAVDPARAPAFAAAIRRYWPRLRAEDLVPDYAGLRPKLTGPGAAPADFLVDGPAEHGLPGLVHLFGIESPGLTASLSLAEEVADRLGA